MNHINQRIPHIEPSVAARNTTSNDAKSAQAQSASAQSAAAQSAAAQSAAAQSASTQPDSAQRADKKPHWQELVQSVALNAKRVAKQAKALLKRGSARGQKFWSERRAGASSEATESHASAPPRHSAPRESRETREAIDRAANEGMLP